MYRRVYVTTTIKTTTTIVQKSSVSIWWYCAKYTITYKATINRLKNFESSKWYSITYNKIYTQLALKLYYFNQFFFRLAFDMPIIDFMAVHKFVLSRPSSFSLPGHICLRRSRTGEQQVVWWDLIENWRESSGDPFRHRIGSSFRINGSKFYMFTL